MLVYATGDCPVCLEPCSPVVAMPCGHAICRPDFERLGGRLRAEAPAPAPAQAPAPVPAPQAVPQAAPAAGNPGIWVLCSTEGSELLTLWHATQAREHAFYEYPEGTRFVGDGRGGVSNLGR